MASTNSLDNNTTRKLVRSFLDGFESSRVLTNTVNTQLLSGKFNPSSGTTVDFKRPHDYKTDRTAAGDISSTAESDIIAAKATGTVQDYITVHMDWNEVDEALKLDQLDEVIRPAGERIMTDLELDFGAYMYKNSNLHYGTPGTAIDAWGDVAGAGALMESIGVPKTGSMYYVMNPFVSIAMAGLQSSLASGDAGLVNSAWQNAMFSKQFGNMTALSSSALASYTSGTLSAGANRAGAVTSSVPDQTYATNKDTMTQSIAVDGFGSGSDTIKAGEIVQITGRNRLGLSTRSAFVDAAGAQVLWAGTVTADVTLSSGAGTLVVAGPAIVDAASNNQYDTCATAIAEDDVITIINPAASTVYQPAMFYHEQAFGIGSVPLKKLYSTDTLMETKDGFQIRISKYADGDANKQKIRFDLLPAYATFNPFFAGQGFGIA